MSISVQLDHEIRLNGYEIPADMSGQIIADLTVFDEEEDEIIDLWEVEGEELVIPRGYAFKLSDLAEEYEIEFNWDDHRVKSKGFVRGEPLPLESEQLRVVEWVLDVEQGIAKAPTGAGKTVMCLEIVRRVPGNSIVIVNTKEIAGQWVQRVKEYLGEDFPVSIVGDGKFEIAKGGLTVAIQGTLHSRRDQLLNEGFFDYFTVCMLDECHHATARTFNEVFSFFSSKIRIGVSATPEKTGLFELAEAIIGPIVVEVEEEDVTRIEKPTIEVIESKLSFGAERRGLKFKKQKKMTYEQMLKGLLADEDRLMLVVNEIMTNWTESRNLVISKRIEHLENVHAELELAGYPGELLVMVGAHSLREREEAIKMIDDGPCVLLTTLADEALDAPLLEVLHLIWPTSNVELVTQQIGRVRRKHFEKLASMVIDYYDPLVPPFRKQYMGRRHDLYNPRGFPVIKRKREKPHERG